MAFPTPRGGFDPRRPLQALKVTMDNYEPSITGSIHTVEITLQDGPYQWVTTVRVGGNTCGFAVLQAAVDFAFDHIVMTLDEERIPGAHIELVGPVDGSSKRIDLDIANGFHVM